MMAKLDVVPATIAHAYALARCLREDDRMEVEAAGDSARTALRRCFRSSVMAKTAFVDGEIACMWGLAGTLLSDVGHPFLLTAPPVERAPLALIRIGKAEIRKMLWHRAHLYDYVAARYTRAIGLLKLFGFQVGEPVPLGPKLLPFCKFEMMRGDT